MEARRHLQQAFTVVILIVVMVSVAFFIVMLGIDMLSIVMPRVVISKYN